MGVAMRVAAILEVMCRRTCIIIIIIIHGYRSLKMVNFCAVVGCSSRSNRDKEKSFYRLPAVITNQGKQTQELSERRRRSWLAAIRRKDIKSESYAYMRVCSEHFVSGKPSKLYDATNPDWSPSLNLGHSCIKQSDTSRHDRASSRAEKGRKVEQVGEEGTNMEEKEVAEVKLHVTSSKDEFEELKQELEKTRSELGMAKAELAKICKELKGSRLDEAGFKENNEKVLYYTELPTWELLLVVCFH